MKRTLLLALTLIAVGCAESEPNPRTVDELIPTNENGLVMLLDGSPYPGPGYRPEYEIVEDLVNTALGERTGYQDKGYDDFGAIWLTQAGDPVMLVFGYSDDMLNCQIIRDAMVEGSIPRRTDYACIPVR